MGNVLDFRTYSLPNQEDGKTPSIGNSTEAIDFNNIPENERKAICYSRGVALHIMSWIRHCCVIKYLDGKPISDLPSLFFVQISATLLNYKQRAEKRKLDGAPHCTYSRLEHQVDNVIQSDSSLREMWALRETYNISTTSLEFDTDNVAPSVEWIENSGWNNVDRLESGAFFHIAYFFYNIYDLMQIFY